MPAIERGLAKQTQKKALSAQVTCDRARQERRPDKPPALYAQSAPQNISGYPRMGNSTERTNLDSWLGRNGYARVMGVECGRVGGFFASAGASVQPLCCR
jgi:hypothetical protein